MASALIIVIIRAHHIGIQVASASMAVWAAFIAIIRAHDVRVLIAPALVVIAHGTVWAVIVVAARTGFRAPSPMHAPFSLG
jgi:hypothetical protein